MPQVTIYLDAELAAQVKAKDVPVSAVCQRALRAELDSLDARRIIDRGLKRSQSTNRRAS